MNIKIELIFDGKDITEDEDDELYKEKVVLTDNDEIINKMIMGYNDYNDIMIELDNIHYEDNIYCSRYLGNHIEDYVMRFLGGKSIPPEMEDRRDGILRRPIDFLLNYEGKEFKIKHIAGCLIYGSIGYRDCFFWEFNIGFNHRADAFILSAWDTRKSLTPQYMWFVLGDQKFYSLPFWKKDVLIIEYNKEKINFMEKFEMKNVRLGKLQNFICHVRKENVSSSLIDSRRKIFLNTGLEISIKILANKLLVRSLEKDYDRTIEAGDK